MSKPSQELKEFCFNECKPERCEVKVYEERRYWNWTDGVTSSSGCWDCNNPLECQCVYVNEYGKLK